jgi:hypothetical protein
MLVFLFFKIIACRAGRDPTKMTGSDGTLPHGGSKKKREVRV